MMWRLTVMFSPGQEIRPGFTLPERHVIRQGSTRELKNITDLWRKHGFYIQSIEVTKL